MTHINIERITFTVGSPGGSSSILLWIFYNEAVCEELISGGNLKQTYKG